MQTAAPVFSPDGGAYPATVTVTCATPGATIAYTIDGTTPTTSAGTQVTTGATIPINQATILQAAAWATGYAESPVTVAAFAPPQGNIPYTNSNVAMDGNLTTESPWSSATWIPINQIYSPTSAGWPDDITSAQWTAFWSNDGNTIYVGVKVQDTQWTFNNSYVTGAEDHVELYIHTTGTGPAAYDTNDASAQQYMIGVNNNESGVWTSMVSGDAVPASANFQAAATVDTVDTAGWVYYEAAITPFQFFGGLEGAANVVSTLYAGETIGLDVLVCDDDYNGTITYISENTLAPKYNNYYAIGQHQLTYASTVSIGQAKNSTANSTVTVSGIVTGVFPSCFYVESADRTFGIRVNSANSGLTVGQIVDLSGPVATMSTGEAAITPSSVVSTDSTGSITPLALTNKNLGGGSLGLQSAMYQTTGLNNVGLLVTTTGTVTSTNPTSSPTSFTIDDGSGVGVTVYGAIPSTTYATVTGACSCVKDTSGNVQRAILATLVQSIP